VTNVETIACPRGHRHLLPIYDVGCWLNRIAELRLAADRMASLAERAVQAHARLDEH